eukprot:TRINITY_DN646_c0_g1_i6.p2 TRINITY_DN646_c0_g1~~TRINITY_DN646_c0_g1_i6.p2  ORF type:complete len:139 (+),score=23.18 TRINITY_DN646_c0_g1_i6:426-842(+)
MAVTMAKLCICGQDVPFSETKLHLTHKKLTSVPAEIFQLTNLTMLGLGNNELTFVPAEICQLTNLTKLNLFNNKLTLLPDEICQLTNLTWLDCAQPHTPMHSQLHSLLSCSSCEQHSQHTPLLRPLPLSLLCLQKSQQ